MILKLICSYGAFVKSAVSCPFFTVGIYTSKYILTGKGLVIVIFLNCNFCDRVLSLFHFDHNTIGQVSIDEYVLCLLEPLTTKQ